MKILIKHDNASPDFTDWTTRKLKKELKDISAFIDAPESSLGRYEFALEAGLTAELAKREAL